MGASEALDRRPRLVGGQVEPRRGAGQQVFPILYGCWVLGVGCWDWGLGIGDWGLGIGRPLLPISTPPSVPPRAGGGRGVVTPCPLSPVPCPLEPLLLPDNEIGVLDRRVGKRRRVPGDEG